LRGGDASRLFDRVNLNQPCGQPRREALKIVRDLDRGVEDSLVLDVVDRRAWPSRTLGLAHSA
jgi:hypothetical protein